MEAILKPAEMEKQIIELAKQRKSPSVIGIMLKDQYGILKVKKTGKKIVTILKEAKVSYKTEKETMKQTMDSLEQHIEKHKHDYTAKKALAKKIWQSKKLT
jgi:small subunit ribosomal protein S15